MIGSQTGSKPAMQALRQFLLALQYFTRVPLPGVLARWAAYSPQQLKAGMAWLPLVGLLVGAVAALALYAAMWLLPPLPGAFWVAALLSTAASVWLTGALHEDGLADTADALGGHVSRERALEIMKDSRIGSYGALALLLALALKCALLVLLIASTGMGVLWALLAAHTLARALVLFTIRLLPHAGLEAASKSRPLANGIDTAPLLIGAGSAAALLLALTLAMPDLPWWAALGGGMAGWGWATYMLHRRLHGFTGDGLGAVQQISELGVYLGLACALGRGL